MENAPRTSRITHWFKTSITARMLTVGILCLILLIPLNMIQDLIWERSNTQEGVIAEINQKWGGEVTLYGPILEVPYKTFKEKIITDSQTKKTQTETVETINYAYFFPDALTVDGKINPEEKKRGIYKTAVYNSTLAINGAFDALDFSDFDVDSKHILWEKSKLILKTSNLKGVNKSVYASVAGSSYAFKAKLDNNHNTNSNNNPIRMHKLESSYIALKDIPHTSKKIFSIDYSVNGSKNIQIIPVGKETKVNLNSNWKTAKFFGEYLPYNPDKITDSGFNAKWKILEINRPFSQQYKNSIPNLQSYALGVNFMIPVDEYLKSTRSAKYGLLVIGLTFLVFFMIQNLSNIQIHAFQYLMIGLALVMFYTLLISISEHSNYLKAYLIATAAVVGLITLYSKTILKGNKFPLFIGVSLTALYTFIFVIIQMEQYALITGSIGLFIILAIVMFASRKINWDNQ